MEFTGVDLTEDAKLAAPVEKAAAGPVEKAVAGRSGEGAVERKAGGSAWWRGRRSGEKASGMCGGEVKRDARRRRAGCAAERGHELATALEGSG